MPFSFSIEKKLAGTRARVGRIETPHGRLETPAFIAVGTKATVKALTPQMLQDIGVQAVLANTYHLYLEPGQDVIKAAGGFAPFMGWNGPTMTDSGGFQVFSLGAAYDADSKRSGISKFNAAPVPTDSVHEKPARIDDDGVSFRSVIDGTEHRFTPETSMRIQHDLGADIIFAFDECTSPGAPYEYQKEAMERTHAWAARSLAEHKRLGAIDGKSQALFGIVQGGRHEDLRRESAKAIGAMSAGGGFDGFGIGGSFDKEDMYGVVGWVNDILPEGKPRHLLGIGEPADLFGGIENGADTFDCVAPTRLGRNGTLYSSRGTVNINNARFKSDMRPLGQILGSFDGSDAPCGCYACSHYSAAYLSHLFRAQEMLAATLASTHNLYFIVNLVKRIRQSIITGDFLAFKERFLARYGSRV